MRLRTYVAALSAFSMVLVVIALTWQMRHVLDDGFTQLRSTQLELVAEILRGGLEAKRSDLADLSRTLRLNSDLASTYVLAKESQDVSLIQNRLRTIQKEVRLDFIDVLSPDKRPVLSAYPPETMAHLAAVVEGEAEGLRVIEIEGHPLLVYFAPLRLFDEPVGLLLVGAQLDTTAAARVSPNNEILFRFLPPNVAAPDDAHQRNIRLFTEKEGELYATVVTRRNLAAGVSSMVAYRLTWIGVLSLLLLVLIFYLMLEVGFVRRFREIVDELVAYTGALEEGELKPVTAGRYRIRENQLLANAFAKLARSILDYERRVQEKSALTAQAEKERAIGEMARQVAHDIRSPLAALNSIVFTLKDIPEADRNLIRGAVARITDISTTMLGRQSKAAEADAPAGEQQLASLIAAIVGEKREQFRGRPVSISFDGENAFGLFANVNPREFQRVISNLIDNAVDSGEKPLVTVQLKGTENEIRILVQDNGTGIPAEIVPRLGERGFTRGKKGGSGLGLYHARTWANRWGGRLEIASTFGEGTTVRLALPRLSAPSWLPSELSLTPEMRVLVLDDDLHIHALWVSRLGGHIVEPFTRSEDLAAWLEKNRDVPKLCLVDYELSGSRQNGLQVIDSLGLAAHSVLVTGRDDDPALRAECVQRGLRLLPKALVSLIPIRG